MITLGRSARPQHVLEPAEELARRGIAVRAASRGGDVTYHGPGQLVGYPVFRLRPGLIAHMQSMSAAIVEVLAALGISGQWRRPGPPIEVIDGAAMADTCIRHGVGIVNATVSVDFVDADFFAEISEG